MAVPEFRLAVVERFNEIKDTEIQDMIDNLVYMSTVYQTAFERNFERHDNMWGRHLLANTAPSVMEIDSFAGQAQFLIDWLQARVTWLDSYFNNREYHYRRHLDWLLQRLN